MEKRYTTKEAADALGIKSTGQVRQLAAALGVGEKWGRDWMFTDADLDRMRQRNTSPGPKGPRTKEGSE
jgi:hypothetical protein